MSTFYFWMPGFSVKLAADLTLLDADRKPVDPPPIIQLRIKDDTDPAQ